MAEEAGRIVSVGGSVEVFRAQHWQPIGLRHILVPGDVVRTGPKSRAAILLSDESLIKVNANSTLEITAVMPPPGKPARAAVGPVQTILNLLKGEVWSSSHGRPFQIRTPAATATIREQSSISPSVSPTNRILPCWMGPSNSEILRGCRRKGGRGGHGQGGRTPK
ncbi:MAG: FecR family protein [Candidatus Methylomirabilis sp.]|nr:FecR family protein [Candidatus Methylomirabilis sp.]